MTKRRARCPPDSRRDAGASGLIDHEDQAVSAMHNHAEAERWVGKSLPRKEENRLLRGRGKFADDIKLREMLYLRFVRSPYAHAKIVSVNTSAAEAVLGVTCTLTGAEVVQQTQPFIEIGPDPFAT